MKKPNPRIKTIIENKDFFLRTIKPDGSKKVEMMIHLVTCVNPNDNYITLSKKMGVRAVKASHIMFDLILHYNDNMEA